MALSDNLIAYWSLDESSGSAIDAHGSNDLTDNNTVAAGTGIISGARDFELSNSEYFSITDNTDLSTGDIDFTFQIWVKLESKSTLQVIAGKWSSTANANQEWLLYYDNSADRFTLAVRGAGDVISSAVANNLGAVSTATWYLVHIWHDATANLIGISGNAGTANTTSHSAGANNGPDEFRIGRNGGTGAEYFDGLADEAAFWKRVLTSLERTELYNSGAARDYAYVIGGAGASALLKMIMHNEG